MRPAILRDLFQSSPWLSTWLKRWQDSPGCGLMACPDAPSSWQRTWRRQRGTSLQGVYYCRPDCLQIALVAHLSRLLAVAPAPPPANRIPLGLLMVARGWLTHAQVLTALAAQQSERSIKIGEWFERLGFATEQEVTSALGLQWGCPVASSLDSANGFRGQIPFAILEAFQMLPLHHVSASNTVCLAFGERVDHAVLYAIEKILDCRTQPCVAGRKNVAHHLEQMRQQARASEVEFGPVPDVVEIGRIGASYIARLGAEDARLERMGPFIWLRLRVRNSYTNLMFRIATDSYPAPDALQSSLPVKSLNQVSVSVP